MLGGAGMLVWSENRNLERQVIGMQETPTINSLRRKAFRDADGNIVGADWKGVDPMYLEDAQAMVLRDRNHPSIIIWSLCTVPKRRTIASSSPCARSPCATPLQGPLKAAHRIVSNQTVVIE